MKNQLNSLWVELLSQLGIKLARKGTINLDDHARRIMRWAGISETQVIKAYRYGEEETPQRFILVDGKYRITVILKPEGEGKKSYSLISCWLSKNWG
jgi:hypothetical protein